MKERKDEHLYFKINGTEFKRIGIYRCCDDEFSIVKIKNCSNGKTKKISFDKLEKILSNETM